MNSRRFTRSPRRRGRAWTQEPQYEATSCTLRLLNNTLLPTTNASIPFRTSSANAVSISPLALAPKISICRPMLAAAVRNSATIELVCGALGSTSRPYRAAPGTSSFRSPSRFGPSSEAIKVTPVRLPLGRLMLATRPRQRMTGSCCNGRSTAARQGMAGSTTTQCCGAITRSDASGDTNIQTTRGPAWGPGIGIGS